MHKVQKVNRNYSFKTLWSTFLAQLFKGVCCFYVPLHLTIRQWYIKGCFWQIFNFTMYIRVYGKMLNQHFNVSVYFVMLVRHFFIDPDLYCYVGMLPKQHLKIWLWSNPGDRNIVLVQILCNQDLRVECKW